MKHLHPQLLVIAAVLVLVIALLAPLGMEVAR